MNLTDKTLGHKFAILLTSIAFLLLAIFSNAFVALADEAKVTLTVITLDKSGQKLANVKIEVTGEDENLEIITDSTGSAKIELPSNKTYTITPDNASIPNQDGKFKGSPKEITIKLPTTLRFEVVDSNFVQESQSATTDTSKTNDSESKPIENNTSFGQQLTQKLISGIVFGLLLAMAAIGVSLIYGTTKLSNFAHGEMVTFGGFMGLVAIVQNSMDPFIGILFALVAGGLFGLFQDVALWGPLRKKGVGIIQLMIVSIGLSLFLRYLFATIWSPQRSNMPQEFNPAVTIFGVGLTYWNILGSIISIIFLVLIGLMLNYTRLGKSARAVADNKALASASGINVNKIIRIIWIISGSLAGVSGVLVSYYQGLSYETGMSILLLIFAAITLGGLGSTLGAVIGSLILSIFIEISTFVIPSSMKVVLALIVLIIILLVRPQGIVGKKQRIG